MSDAELRARLRHPDPRVRAQWMGGPEARLPGGVDGELLDRFRADLVLRLRRAAFHQARD